MPTRTTRRAGRRGVQFQPARGGEAAGTARRERFRRSARAHLDYLDNARGDFPQQPPRKAIGAVKHSMLVATWHMLTNGQLYNDLGPDYYRRRDPVRTTNRLVAQLERLGHTVTLKEAAT